MHVSVKVILHAVPLVTSYCQSTTQTDQYDRLPGGPELVLHIASKDSVLANTALPRSQKNHSQEF